MGEITLDKDININQLKYDILHEIDKYEHKTGLIPNTITLGYGVYMALRGDKDLEVIKDRTFVILFGLVIWVKTTGS